MLHISCNIGMNDLPDMYALSPQALDIHIRQITHTYVTTITCMYASGFGHTYQANHSYLCYNYYMYVCMHVL